MSSDADRMLQHERRLWGTGVHYVAGIDEAGRGPLAGPVVAAAVIFSPGTFLPGVDDSKKLTPLQREKCFDEILRDAVAVGIGTASHEIIDRINILQATFLAMHDAVNALARKPHHLLVDGNRFAGRDIPFTTIVGGDGCCFSIAAASIVAKVTRDRMMMAYDRDYPEYGFARHKGYGTAEHREAIARLGRCPIHRQSFILHSVAEE